ncbi:hypothetical protein, partial [Achromobacter sp.]
MRTSLFAPRPDTAPPRSRLVMRRCACGCGGKSKCAASSSAGRARAAVPDQVEDVLRSAGQPLA